MRKKTDDSPRGKLPSPRKASPGRKNINNNNDEVGVRMTDNKRQVGFKRPDSSLKIWGLESRQNNGMS